MSTNNSLMPGYYKLNFAVLITNDGKKIDILNMLPTFNFQESIENDSIRGSALIIDTSNLIDILPLRGEEKLEIQIEDPLKNVTDLTLFVYKITDLNVKDTNDGVSYTIHFTSIMRWGAGKHKIIKSYDLPAAAIVEDIYTTYYGIYGTKELLLDDTEGFLKCVIPNYTPMQAINFLQSRSFSTSSPSCSFRFFETTERFYYLSDESLIRKAIKEDSIKEFSFFDSLPKSTETLLAQMKNLIELRNTDRLNSVSDVYSGAYRNNVIEIDFTKRQIIDNRYDFSNYRSSYAKPKDLNIVIEQHTSEFEMNTFNEENERRFLVFKDYSSVGDEPSNIRQELYTPKITSNRLAYNYHLNKNTVLAKSYGRLDLHAGDVLNIVVPEFTYSTAKSFSTKIGGHYLIHTCEHSFVEDLYETHLKLVKFDWSI